VFVPCCASSAPHDRNGRTRWGMIETNPGAHCLVIAKINSMFYGFECGLLYSSPPMQIKRIQGLVRRLYHGYVSHIYIETNVCLTMTILFLEPCRANSSHPHPEGSLINPNLYRSQFQSAVILVYASHSLLHQVNLEQTHSKRVSMGIFDLQMYISFEYEFENETIAKGKNSP
jgi:hypothetical protein